MGLFSKKTLNDLLEQRSDQLLADQVSPLFYPDPTWAYEKDTGLPMMFRFSAKLGDIPYSVEYLCSKNKDVKKIGQEYYDETVDAYTFLEILRKRHCSINALVPFFIELYGMKENLLDHCGTLEQLFADASFKAAKEWLDRPELNHAGQLPLVSAITGDLDRAALFPYAEFEENDDRNMSARKIDFIEHQKSFLTGLLKNARARYEELKDTDNPKKTDYHELMTDVRVVILWLAMHKVPWALRMYCDGTLLEDSNGNITIEFPIGYYYSNIDTDYVRDFERRKKAYTYSVEKARVLLKEAEKEYAELKSNPAEKAEKLIDGWNDLAHISEDNFERKWEREMYIKKVIGPTIEVLKATVLEDQHAPSVEELLSKMRKFIEYSWNSTEFVELFNMILDQLLYEYDSQSPTGVNAYARDLMNLLDRE